LLGFDEIWDWADYCHDCQEDLIKYWKCFGTYSWYHGYCTFTSHWI